MASEVVVPASASDAEVRAACHEFRQVAGRLRAQAEHVVVGQGAVVREVLIALLSGGHVLLEGMPGLGKTLLVRTLAQALSLTFGRIQCTPDLMPADITGTTVIAEDPNTHRRRQHFRTGPIFHQILLVDEINRATPKSQSALLEAMQEHQVTAGSETRRLPEPFFVLATQNPIEQEGTYPLPEAQLDRFLMKVLVPGVTLAGLNAVLSKTTTASTPEVKPVLDERGIARAMALARQVAVAAHVRDFAIRLVMATRPDGAECPERLRRFIAVGASPRALQALVCAARVRALFDGRHAISTVDIAAMARPCLRHRLARSFEAEAEGRTVDAIIDALVAQVPRVPEDHS
ncbi:MAG: AAA family ATPase [Planctomycetota bacterium]|nr:AAA family ATPase [Planctomycetota bacterium]MDA1105801.1 AAA family ATPase [Planctomycetota bacterium]